MSNIHPLVDLFRQRAELLDLQMNRLSLDDGIAQLAIWMELAADHLTEDDYAMLGQIGAILYREGLQRRLPK